RWPRDPRKRRASAVGWPGGVGRRPSHRDGVRGGRARRHRRCCDRGPGLCCGLVPGLLRPPRGARRKGGRVTQPLVVAVDGPAGVVMEGRDIGTVVFPDAPVKLYLTAAPVERARRRAVELRARGETIDEAALARDIAARDRRDSERAHSPLRPAADAVVLDTTTLTLETVVDEMERIARARLGASRP